MRQPWFKFWTSAREDSKLRSLDDFEFRYWVQLLCLAAESGGKFSLADPDDVCVEIGLLDDEHHEPCVGGLEQIISKLVRRKLVTRYTSEEGVEWVSFNGWERRQAKPSDRPEAVKERVARHRERQRNADVTRYVTPTEAEADKEKDTSSSTSDEVFPEFWSLYPKKVGKRDAMKAWKSVTKDTDPQTIIAGLKAHRFDDRDGGKFIPYPATWLRAGRWEDVVPFTPDDDERYEWGERM